MIHISGYKRIEAGKVGGFELVHKTFSTSANLTSDIGAMVTKFGPTENLVIQMDPNGLAISIAPQHDEEAHGFETHPFQICVKPAVGIKFNVMESAIVAVKDAGALVAKMAA